MDELEIEGGSAYVHDVARRLDAHERLCYGRYIGLASSAIGVLLFMLGFVIFYGTPWSDANEKVKTLMEKIQVVSDRFAEQQGELRSLQSAVSASLEKLSAQLGDLRVELARERDHSGHH